MTGKYNQREWGTGLESSTGRFDPDFLKALRIFAKRETEREGFTVSQALILETSTLQLQTNKELRDIFKQLKKERNDAIKKGRPRGPQKAIGSRPGA